MSGIAAAPEGITNPPIDELLAATDSKYSLVIYAAKRARQINAYYSQLGEGLLEYVGPLVETHVQEKPLSIALREINAGLLTAEKIDRGLSRASTAESTPSAGRPRRRRRHRRLQGRRAAPAADRDRPRRPRRPDRAALQFVGAADLGRAVRPPGRHRRLGRRRTRSRTSGSARQADLVVVAPATADLLARAAHGLADDLLTNTLLTARCPVRVGARPCTPRCGSTRPPQANVATLREPRRRSSSSPPSAG